MSNKLKYLSLLILPALLIFSASTLKDARGPYYLNLEDPSYVYLINSLNVSLRFPVGHFDHPGTTVQVIGAVTIRLYYWLNNSSADLITDVLSRPEEYLSQMNKIFILISSATLFFLGIITFNLSRNILLSLLIQLSPFISLEIFYGYKIVASDNFLITVSLFFTGILIYYLFKVNADKDSPMIFVLVFALICGMGLATKISFFPFILIPLLLIKGFKNKLLFLLFVSISFLVFVIPAISNYDKFIEWVWMLFLYDGSYGLGDPSVVDLPGFFKSLTLIFQRDLIFSASYIFSITTIVLVYFTQKKEGQLSEKQRKEFKLLLYIVLSITIQIIIVAKHYRQHYMIPSFVLSMFSLSLCALLLSAYFKKLKLRTAYLIIIIMVTVVSFYKIFNSYYYCLMLRDEAYKVNRYVKEHSSNALLIPAFCSANKEFALALGISCSGRKIKLYKSILSTLQTENIFYIHWIDEFFSLTSKENVRKILHENRKIMFQTTQSNVGKFVETLKKIYDIKTVSIKLLFSNKINESVYEINIESLNEEKK